MASFWHKSLFLLILSICLIVPFSNNIFISGLPAISAHFPNYNVSLILSFGLLGLAIAQPFYGPFLDRFGRRPVLLFGLWLYTLASAQVMLTDSFTWLLVGRFWQSVGACSAIISVFAIAKDTYSNKNLVKATSLIMAIIAIGPTIAPLCGSFLTVIWGWRASFVFLFLIGCLFTLVIHFFFKETLVQKNMAALVVKNIIEAYSHLLKTPLFLTYCIASGLAFGILFSYFGLSPIFIIKQMHFGVIAYGVIVALNSIAIIGATILVPKCASKISLLHITLLGCFILLGSGIAMWAVNYYFIVNIYTFFIPMFFATIGIGIIRPATAAGAMCLANPKNAGFAAALFSFISFAISALATTLSAKWVDQISCFGLFIVAVAFSSSLYIIYVNRQLLRRQRHH